MRHCWTAGALSILIAADSYSEKSHSGSSNSEIQESGRLRPGPESDCNYEVIAPTASLDLGEQDVWSANAYLRSRVYLNNELGNRALDTGTRQIWKTPGTMPASVTPDGKFVVFPSRPDSNRGFDVFDSKDLDRKQNLDAAQADVLPVYAENNLQGSSQSWAVLKKTKTEIVYRMVTDSSWADFRFKDAQFSKINGAEVAPCSASIAGPLQLPMLSKDGRFMAAFNSTKKSTWVYRVDIKNPSKCDEILDLGMVTGRVDFSPDNSQLVFFVDQPEAFSENLKTKRGLGGDPRFSQKSAVSVNFQTDRLKNIGAVLNYNRWTVDIGAQEPKFSEDGRVVILSKRSGRFSVDYYDSQGVGSRNWPTITSVQRRKKDHPSSEISARPWDVDCIGKSALEKSSLKTAAFSLDNIDSSHCKKVVTERSVGFRTTLRRNLKSLSRPSADSPEVVSQQDLLAVCPD